MKLLSPPLKVRMNFPSPTLLATGETIGSVSLGAGAQIQLNAVSNAVVVINLIGIVLVGRSLFAASTERPADLGYGNSLLVLQIAAQSKET